MSFFSFESWIMNRNRKCPFLCFRHLMLTQTDIVFRTARKRCFQSKYKTSAFFPTTPKWPLTIPIVFLSEELFLLLIERHFLLCGWNSCSFDGLLASAVSIRIVLASRLAAIFLKSEKYILLTTLALYVNHKAESQLKWMNGHHPSLNNVTNRKSLRKNIEWSCVYCTNQLCS